MKDSFLKFGMLAIFALVAFGLLASPEQDFDSALKAGKPLSAEAAYLGLVKANAHIEPIRHFQAAEIAGQLGKPTTRKDRLMLYLRSEKGWTPEVEQSLWILAASGAGIEYYERLAANQRPTSMLWRVGSTLLGQLDAANRPSEMIRLADILFAKFSEPARRRHVLQQLYQNAQRMGAGYPEKELVDLVYKHAGLGDLDVFHGLVANGAHAKAFAPDFAFRYAAKHGDVRDSVLAWQIAQLDSPAVAQLTEPGQVRDRDACVANLRKIRKLCFDGRHPDSAYRYFRVATIHLPKLFWKTVDESGYVPGSYAMLKELMAHGRYAENASWRQQVNNLARNAAIDLKRFSPQEVAALVDADPDSFSVKQLQLLSSLGNVTAAIAKSKSMEPLAKLAQKFPSRAYDIYRANFYSYTMANGRAGDVASVKRIFLDVMKQERNPPYSFVDQVVANCTSMTIADKLALFKSAYAITGHSSVWKEFKRRASAAKGGGPFYGNADVKAFGAALREDALPSDPHLRLYAKLDRAKTVDDVVALEGDFKRLCPGKFGEGKTARENALSNHYFSRYYNLAVATPAGSRRFVDYALKNLTANGPYTWIEGCLKKINDPALWLEYRRLRATVQGSYDQFAGVVVEKDADKPVGGIDMKKMSAGAAATYFTENYRRLKPSPARDQLYFDFAAAHPLETNALATIAFFLEAGLARSFVGDTVDSAFLARFPLDRVMDAAFATPARNWEWGLYLTVVQLGLRAGKAGEVLKRYGAWADSLDPVDRLSAYVRLLGSPHWVSPQARRDGCWAKLVADGTCRNFLQKTLLPALASLPARQAGAFDFSNPLFWEVLANCRAVWSAEKTGDAAGVAAVDAVFLAGAKLILAGARNSEGLRSAETFCWHEALETALAASNRVAVARVARAAGASLGVVRIGEARVRRILAALKASGDNEAFYLYVDAVPGDEPAWIVAEAAKSRAAVASSLPGIYPVGEKDPAYPLYIAADELAKKNPERAWQILKDPKNQTVFEREALKLPPDFVIWGVEQMRLARGTKDALLLKARQIATSLLAQEGKLSSEMAAAMVLSRAEGFRDQQNFEAAKLEYQSIRDNPTYHATPYGKKAMFRAVDLQIASGNLQGVEATLEYWLSQNDREIQAEAHYFLARIAFDRKDYDTCIKHLRQVFAIDYTHTDGRFLQGEWKLATNSEVDETEVLVGKLGDRSMIKPGNQFTITVQDANLSVAGGGASIPVILTTKPGNDWERVNLYPTSRDPSNFKGLVEVVLGKANQTNRVLEVRGDDTVSYVIAPEFLKERGLPLNTPKDLHVVDDAKVAIGAGAPRTEEKKTEKGVKDLLEEGGAPDDSVSRRLRPGNPLYVVVQDRDRSRGGEADTLEVSVETSSGDRLEGFSLKEEKPYTGVFRGKIETSLPPPRAFASDSAAGLNPGDVINANKTGGWKSLADGQPGKWFEVDTMGSHLFSEIVLDTPSAADIKSIKLVGRMGSRVLSLGQLPAATEVSKLSLRRQQQNGGDQRPSLDQLRAFCQTDKAAQPAIVEQVDFRVPQGNARAARQTALYHGPFEVPEGVDSFRLRIVPKSAKKDALRDLWLALAIDGEEVFSGQGTKLQNVLMAPDVTAGCHQFELAVVASSVLDDFDLAWEPIGRDVQPFPGEWFDVERHPSLRTFVKDRAQIVKTANGFKAVFDRPVRLRSFRWEFADVKSPDVAVTRIRATDDHGEKILPVPSDFSDSQGNRTLEVAPGDKITLRYEDERTTSGEKKVHQRQMDSSFNDASVRFIFEEPTASGSVIPYDAFRFQPGDTLVLAVTDPDCDTTDGADKIEVDVQNRLGETFTRKLIEYRPRWFGNGTPKEEADGMHTGLFMGILKTCAEGDTNAPPRVLRVKSDDLLTVSYIDRENTDPGVPCPRIARIFAARPTESVLTLFDIRKVRKVDTSDEAKAKLARIRRRPGNENVQVVYVDTFTAEPMPRQAVDSTNPIPVNVSAGFIPLRVNDRSRARYAGSKIQVDLVAHSERAKAAAAGREPEHVTALLHLGGSLAPLTLTRGDESQKEAYAAGTFNGIVRLSLGPVDPNVEVSPNAPPVLCVTGSDLVDVTILGEDGEPVLTRTLKLVADARLGLTDSSFEAERPSAHVGESFFAVVDDADRDLTDEPDTVEAEVVSAKTGRTRKLILSETMPHSGVFTGRLSPVMFAPGETVPSVSTGGVASAHEVLTEHRFAVGYGDSVIFRYRDDLTLPGTPPRTLSVTGTVFRGSNGDVRLFSKRFSDRDSAVLVQFRLAECLFEQAKEYRKLKQSEKSAAAISEGKLILEEALKNYPDSAHVVQGEYLLANLYQELAAEQKENGDREKAIPLYQEALSRFSQILGTWPEGDYAARSQYHKAYCLEMLEDYDRASEEYVKMTYLYPESELVGDATIRLATYYYTKERRYDVSGHIYKNFQQRFPQHAKAARALFMAGSCYIKQAETLAAEAEKLREQNLAVPPGAHGKISAFYMDAVQTFDRLVDVYRESDPRLKAQALYWAGDVCVRSKNYAKAYQYLKRTVFEYPETEWARRARGLLLQEGAAFKNFNE